MSSDSNPARRSAMLERLFPPGAVAAELIGSAGNDVLTDEERSSIAHCAESRIRDFTAGRACARRALAELGIRELSILAGENREPLWPGSIVGSITHTSEYAAAVAAPRAELLGVGIDCEQVEAVTENLWPRLFNRDEIEGLESAVATERRARAALLFAAKEAFYKFQFPLTREWVGFQDVSIELPDELSAILLRTSGAGAGLAGASATSGRLQGEGTFRIRARRVLSLSAGTESLFNRYRFQEQRVIVGVSLPAA